MTIKQYKAKGHFVDTVLQVVALDDAVALIAFSVCATVAGMTEGSGAVRAQDILLPLAYNVAAILVGGALAFVLKWLMQRVTSDYNRLLLVVIMPMAAWRAPARRWTFPPLACMVLRDAREPFPASRPCLRRWIALRRRCSRSFLCSAACG